MTWLRTSKRTITIRNHLHLWPRGSTPTAHPVDEVTVIMNNRSVLSWEWPVSNPSNLTSWSYLPRSNLNQSWWKAVKLWKPATLRSKSWRYQSLNSRSQKFKDPPLSAKIEQMKPSHLVWTLQLLVHKSVLVVSAHPSEMAWKVLSITHNVPRLWKQAHPLLSLRMQSISARPLNITSALIGSSV